MSRKVVGNDDDHERRRWWLGNEQEDYLSGNAAWSDAMKSEVHGLVRYMIVGGLLTLLPLSGCTGEVERRWTEEVEIESGRIIEVDRYVKFTESNSIAGDAYNSTALESTLSFKGELSGLPAWRVPLVPILLYHDTTANEWAVVAVTPSCDVWADRGSPVPPYWEFRLVGGNWEERPLSAASIGRDSNLFFDYEPGLPTRRITPPVKSQVIRSKNYAKRYLSVDGNIKSRCMRRI